MLKESTPKQLLEAGIAAISQSRLAEWDPERGGFLAQSNGEVFEKYNASLGLYGRWICWTLFSVGVENIVKATCVANGFRPKVSFLGYELPSQGASSAVSTAQVRAIGKAPTSGVSDVQKLDYKTLGYFWQHRLPDLAKDRLTTEEAEFVTGAIRLLTELVRNRDAHTYQPDQRQSNFYLVEQVFVPCLNKLVKAIPTAEKVNLMFA